MADPQYAIIILTWNSRQHIGACIDSLAAAAPERTVELIVVDNGSSDGTREMVRERAPNARLVCNRTNRGVAAARNQGLVLARAPVAVILDVDTVVMPGAFSRLLSFLDAAPNVGVCGPRLLLPDDTVQPSCQLFPTVLDKIARQLPRRLGEPWLRSVELADWNHHGVRDVDYVVGACQAIRMDALRDVGWLDERIFYGPEDVDFCIRMRMHGWRVTYLGDAVVRHECQRVTRQRLNILTLRHAFGLAHLFRTHRYLWSRSSLYRRIADAERAAHVSGVHGSACELAS